MGKYLSFFFCPLFVYLLCCGAFNPTFFQHHWSMMFGLDGWNHKKQSYEWDLLAQWVPKISPTKIMFNTLHNPSSRSLSSALYGLSFCTLHGSASNRATWFFMFCKKKSIIYYSKCTKTEQNSYTSIFLWVFFLFFFPFQFHGFQSAAICFQN